MQYVVQLFTAFLGSLGFAMLFNIRKDKLLPAAFGGMLAWGIYIIAGAFSNVEPARYFIASVGLTIYAEVFARIKRTPTTVFLVSTAIPLIPGGSLYKAMDFAMRKDMEGFVVTGAETLLLAMAIAGGILSTMVLVHVVLRSSKNLRDFRKM